MIIGIDPGVKTGVAALSLNGDFLFVDSRRNFSKSEIVKKIGEVGEPIIIATDVVRPPSAVRKISSSFNARIFSPKRRFTKIEKEKTANKLKLCYHDHHERDAMLAAAMARRNFLTLFNKIDSALKRRNLLYMADEVKELIVKKAASNIEQAIIIIKSNIYNRK